jgi:BirA family biotin operon repressor/biotin-[acetyl-CoA-carboxylase] ligase
MKFIKLESVESTNIYAFDLLANQKVVDETTVVYSNIQTKGKGLGANVWHSEDYKNLSFSIIVFPDAVADKHFVLSMLVSLAICEYLESKGVAAKIKWPNDIYYQNRKLAGILIENSILGELISSSVIGVGLNLNQKEFPTWIPNPISLTNITGVEYDIKTEIEIIAKFIANKIQLVKIKSVESIKSEYLAKLFRLQEKSVFKLNEERFTAKIIDVKPDGHLVLKTESDTELEFYFKEIEFCE